MSEVKYFYIYNFAQAKFFIDNGLSIIDISKGNKNDIYHKFIRNEISEIIFMKWKQLKYGERAI